ncbi:hypothetical protein BX666DRAFT_1857732 [Dichotomocladium elegans]|nr:hypothetical protein BX666DRAFT_1857732 [Dichotomocladium elegans]
MLSFPEYSRLSELGDKFILEVHSLNERRRMFCTVEYPLSFTGEEAVEIIKSLLPAGVPEGIGLCVARAFLRTVPPLVNPISYSEKSFKRNTLYESASEVYTLNDETIDSGVLPQGVITPLTRCYTQSCFPGQGGCYAPLCPNRVAGVDDDEQTRDTLQRLDRQASLKSMTSSHDTSLSSRSWTASMPREVLLNTADAEIKRQEAIHEIIYTEEDYVRDLVLLEELFATPLRTTQILDEERRDEFCNHVFNNYKEILDIHRGLCRDLQDRQSAAAVAAAGNRVGFVDGVGDIFQHHLPRFMAAYDRYGPRVILAEHSAKQEARKNVLFQNFIRDTEKLAECRKLPFRHFLILPVTRLQRYPLLIGAILKRTPNDHPDKAYLSACCDILKEIASNMDERTEETKKVLRLMQIQEAIRYKPSEESSYHMLQLLHPERRLLHEGPMTRRSQTGVETIDLHIFLFDHLLLMTKTKKTGSDKQVEYHISKRPIPLELLQVQDATEGFALGLRQLNTSLASPRGTGHLQSMTSPTAGLVMSAGSGQNQLHIHHLGKHGGDHLLYAKTADIRTTWKERIVAAKAAFERAHPENQAFEIRSLTDTTFTGSNAHGQTLNHGRVSCSIPFEGFNGIRMLAVGTNMGLWMGMEGDTTSMRQVLSLADIHQIAVLEAEHILHISYFEAGFCNNRTLVIAMKKRGMDSHFRALEPTCGDLRDPKNAKFLTTKSGLFGAKSPPPWFHTYKEFYIGADSFAIHLLKARVAVVCTRGFEIIDLDHLTMNRNLPDLSHPDFAPISQRDDVRPLAMFRSGPSQYLLCYNAFAFLVDSHGTLIQGSWIEWEGTPQSVAFCPPYVVAFDPRFIEVRHAESGRLIQILAGDHMRMLQFTTSAGMPTPLIHGCMSHPFKSGYQYVFQLTATFEPTF